VFGWGSVAVKRILYIVGIVILFGAGFLAVRVGVLFSQKDFSEFMMQFVSSSSE